MLEFTEVLAVPVEDGSLSVQQLPPSHVAQSDNSATDSVAVWTQTAFEQIANHPSQNTSLSMVLINAFQEKKKKFSILKFSKK